MVTCTAFDISQERATVHALNAFHSPADDNSQKTITRMVHICDQAFLLLAPIMPSGLGSNSQDGATEQPYYQYQTVLCIMHSSRLPQDVATQHGVTQSTLVLK